MAIFDEREKALEQKWLREQETAFAITARRNKRLGFWAAGQMGLTNEAAARYASAIVDAEVLKHNDEAIVGRVYADLVAGGVQITEAEVRRKLKALTTAARKELGQET